MIDPFQAILCHDIQSLNRYLEHGNVNCIDKHGRTLLHLAIKLEETEAVQILLRAYINVDAQDEDGNTCFHYAVRHNRISYLRVLFKGTGNPMMKNKAGQTPLYMACRYAKEQAIDLYLEKYQLDMGETDNTSETIFMALIRSKSVRLIKKYGGYEPWLEYANYLGNTPLIIAAERNSGSMVSFLLEHSIFVNTLNHMGESALFYAVKHANKAMIDLLIKHGAFPYFKTTNAEDIYSIATPEIKEYIAERLHLYRIDTYAKKYPLHYAIYLQDEKLILKHLSLKTIFIEDSFGFTPAKLAELYHNKFVLNKIKDLNRVAKIAVFETK